MHCKKFRQLFADTGKHSPRRSSDFVRPAFRQRTGVGSLSIRQALSFNSPCEQQPRNASARTGAGFSMMCPFRFRPDRRRPDRCVLHATMGCFSIAHPGAVFPSPTFDVSAGGRRCVRTAHSLGCRLARGFRAAPNATGRVVGWRLQTHAETRHQTRQGLGRTVGLIGGRRASQCGVHRPPARLVPCPGQIWAKFESSLPNFFPATRAGVINFAAMPTIEFNGYTLDEAERMLDRARVRLADLPFREDIVFVKRGPSQVIAWDGSERPFIRVLTRKQERADRIRDRLTSECDLEIVLIDFIPCATG